MTTETVMKKARKPAGDFREFCRAIKRAGWTPEQVAGDEPPPETLKALMDEMGQEKFEAFAIRYLDQPSPPRTVPVPETGELPPEPVQTLPGASSQQETASEAETPTPKPDPKDGPLTWLPPVTEKTEFSEPVQVWWSACRRYKVIRADHSPDPRFLAIVFLSYASLVAERIISNDHKRLRPAMEAAVKHFLEQFPDRVDYNTEQTIRVAEETGLHKLTPRIDEKAKERLATLKARKTAESEPDEKETTMSEKTNVLEVDESLARQMLVEMGFAGAESGWQPTKLVKVLNRIPERLGACEETKTKVAGILLDQVVKALSDGKTIALASTNGEVPEAAKEPKAKKMKATKKKKSGRPKIFGKYSAGPFTRWLGHEGIGIEVTKEILEGEGCLTLSDGSIKWELKERREDKQPAPVTKEEAKILKEKYPDAF